MATRNRNPSWSDLPQELLSDIANSLTPDPIDILAFRSVCNSWRSSFPRLPHLSLLSPPLPLTLPRLPCPYSYCENSHASLTVTIIYALRPPLFPSLCSSWFLFLDEFTPAKFRLREPFSNYTFLPFTFPKIISLSDFSRLELGRFYNLRYDYNNYKTCDQSVEVSRVVVFPNRSAVIALYDDGTLWMLMVNLGFSEWEIIHNAKEFCFDDIVEFKGRVLGVDRSGTLYEITYDSPNMNVVVLPIAEPGGRRKRLVESLGLLYLIVGFDLDPTINEQMRITKFTVFELNEEKKEWFPVSSIGDRSFFVGLDFSFSASSKELATCGKNCVFFKESSFRSYNINYHNDSLTQALFKNELDIRVYHLNDDIRICEMGSYPGYSDVLWPPPSWIWGVDRLKRLEGLETACDQILDKFSDNDKIRLKRQSIQILEGKEFAFGDRMVMDLLKLKEVVNMFQEGGNKFMDLEKKLEEPMSMHDVRESINMLDQIDSQLVLPRTTCYPIEERLGWPDELQTALEQFDTRDAVPSHLARHVLRQRDLLLFKLEKFVSSVVRTF